MADVLFESNPEPGAYKIGDRVEWGWGKETGIATISSYAIDPYDGEFECCDIHDDDNPRLYWMMRLDGCDYLQRGCESSIRRKVGQAKGFDSQTLPNQ